MNNRNIALAKRRSARTPSAAKNPILSGKKAQIFDDTWLEALKHLTWSQWSLMSLVSRQVNGVIQRNLTRLPPPVIESAEMSFNFWFHPRFEHAQSSMARSLELLFHPIVYFKEVTIYSVHQKLSNIITNVNDRHIRCQSFNLNTSGDTPDERPNISALSSSLKWLERNVRSDSISFPKWVSYRVHETVTARSILSNFIFGISQKCKAHELIFARCEHQVEFLNGLIEEFLAFPVVQGSIPTVIIDHYSRARVYRAHLGILHSNSSGTHLFVIKEDGSALQQITFNENGYDSFPALNSDGSLLLWSSNRNSSTDNENDVNIFVARMNV